MTIFYVILYVLGCALLGIFLEIGLLALILKAKKIHYSQTHSITVAEHILVFSMTAMLVGIAFVSYRALSGINAAIITTSTLLSAVAIGIRHYYKYSPMARIQIHALLITLPICAAIYLYYHLSSIFGFPFF